MASDPGRVQFTEGRIVHFVRHGQYESGRAGERLTSLGRRQALLVARRFRHLAISRVHSSTAPRALQTAEILCEALGIASFRRTPLLKEMLPTRVPGLRVPRAKQREGQSRLNAIRERFFTSARGLRHEVVVGHGNLIRSLVLCASAGRAHGFQHLLVCNASVTSFHIGPEGVLVFAMNEQSHLPPRLRSEL